MVLFLESSVMATKCSRSNAASSSRKESKSSRELWNFGYDLVLACVKSLDWIARKGLENNQEDYGFDEPRIMLKLCYLGILALKQKRRGILTEVGASIYEFEEQFFKKHFANLPREIDPDKHIIIGLP